MDNINGALAFQATLDIDDFNVSADAMERHIRKASTGIQMEADSMEQRLLDFAKRGAMYIQTYLVGGAMGRLLQSIVQVRGQFQQLEIAFGTMLGNEKKAKALMDEMVNTAARTPFDLMGVASGAKQLLAYGVAADKVNDTLVRLGNIASGLSIPLNDIVYLYGTTMVQGRLYAQDVRQFTGRGIPLVKELAKAYGVTTDEINAMVSAGKIGFADVEKVLNGMTNEGGQFYNLMAKQSASLTGMISNLEDAWDSMLNEIGTANQDTFASAIESASFLVEHYQKILDILGAVAIAYGTYKAAVVANTLATKGYTGVALIDNTVRQTKIAMLKAEAIATGKVMEQTKMMQVAEEAHVASLEKELTVEELANVKKQIRIATIQSLLTEQQAEYLSNIGLTESSQGYEAAAMSVLNVEQQLAVKKLDLSSKSAVYRAALEQEVASKKADTTATLENMRAEVSAAARKVESAKQDAVIAMQRVENARYEVYWTRQSGDATALATAQKKLEAAVETQTLTRKTALAAQTDFLTKKKALETMATRQSTTATAANNVVTSANNVATSTGIVATNGLTAAKIRLSRAIITTKNAMNALKVAFMTNPWGWIISVVGLVASAFMVLRNSEEEVEEKTGDLSNAVKKATEEFNEQAAKVDALKKVMENGNASYEERNKAINELKRIIPGYNAELTREGEIINNNTEAINRYLIALEKQIKLKAAQEELEEAYRKKRTLEKKKREQERELGNAIYGTSQVPENMPLGTLQVQSQLSASEVTKKNKELAQTKEEIKEVEGDIHNLNNEIATTSTEIAENTTEFKSYSEQLAAANNRVKNLRQEISDLRSGKVQKENIAKAIEEKQRDLQAAEAEVAALTGKTKPKGGSSTGNANAVTDKELEAQRRLEEARIEVMEEGYAKRKATLDLQHKNTLAQIDREERELEQARKKAGKGGLSEDEKAGFDERRSLANQAYTQEANRLFDGEIDYKKRQYEAYFKWVENGLKDEADIHFKSLLAEGTSFTAWINSQIQELEAKKEANGTLDDGDANALNALRTQRDELLGNKSAMDLFKESVQQTVGQAQTLAEKLEAVADLKEKLARGDFHLNDDETAAAALQLNNEESNLNKRVDQEVMQNYRTYEEEKLAIVKQYQLLREAAERSGNAERVRIVNEGEAAALSALNANMLKQSESWKRLFGDLDSLSASQLDKLIKDIESQLKDADLQLNPVDYKAMIESLNKAKEMLEKKNPFKALGSFYDSYISAKKKLKAEEAKLAAGEGSQEEVDKARSEMKKSAKGVTESIEEVTDMATQCGQSLANMFDALGMEDVAEGLGTAIELTGQLGNAAASVGRIYSGDVIGGVSGLVSSVTSVVGIFSKLHDKKYEKRIKALQDDIRNLERAYDRLDRAFENTFWVFTDEERQNYDQRKNAIEAQIAYYERLRDESRKTFEGIRNYSKYANKVNELKDELAKHKEGGDMKDIYEAERENLKKQQKDLEGMISAEKGKKKTNWDAIHQWEDQIISINNELEDMERQMIETMAGTSIQSAIDEFADALVDAYCKGEDAAEALGEKTKAVLKNAVVEALKRQFLAQGINDAVKYLGNAIYDDNVLSDEERAEFEKRVNAAGDLFNTALEGIGDWIKDAEEVADPLEGAVKSMSEETGGVIAGRLNAFIINQGDQTAKMREILVYQAQISANTKATVSELQEIKSELKSIRNGGGTSLLSQGIA